MPFMQWETFSEICVRGGGGGVEEKRISAMYAVGEGSVRHVASGGDLSHIRSGGCSVRHVPSGG